MNALDEIKIVLESYTLDRVNTRVYSFPVLVVPFRARFGYELTKVYDEGKKDYNIVVGLQQGVSISEPREILELLYIPEFLIQDEELARNLVAFSRDDMNTLFTTCIKKRKPLEFGYLASEEERELCSSLYDLDGNEKIQMLKTNAEWRGKSRDCSKVLLSVWIKKFSNQKNYPRDKDPQLYDAITNIAELFIQEMN